MNFKPLKTARLTLIPADLSMLEYEINRNNFPKSLFGITVPKNWPHESVSRGVSEIFLTLFRENKLYNYYWILNEESKKDILIGSGGFIVQDDGTLELGYSVLKQFEDNGFASEAVSAIIKNVNGFKNNIRITAKTKKKNIASVRVLEKSGFSLFGFDSETDLLIYSLVTN
ncbi:GNAT family N-acetyltransferase [Methanomicrobium antiquum]|uniref:GNAT family N-acetyltransferase n=1 Tax=Methanomicrobium antiquum TaxID=487686 RepID=A0AAF0FZS5_9EURY|nr:GNAT family N-acetyltransferase [Methanomicrobium antiquum]MDD3976574.1 GNAT family N-acetyltransferase [Methanomicrobium sp.]WFN37519.1 GNAT family N-acetyltransferase [Methanomicrobium antiquum]